MRFINKSGVTSIVKAPSMTDDNICIAFDNNVQLNQTNDDIRRYKLCDEKQPAGTKNNNTSTNANNSKASNTLTIKTDGAIIPKAIQVQPTFIRKTPKFPSRERHMAIRRKKPSTLKNIDGDCRCVRRPAHGKCNNDDDVTK